MTRRVTKHSERKETDLIKKSRSKGNGKTKSVEERVTSQGVERHWSTSTRGLTWVR